MCGRYLLSDPQKAIELLEPVLADPARPDDLEPRYNIAPTQLAPIVANRSQRVVEMARWGLVPVWAKDPSSVGSVMINARSESLADKPAFREAYHRRRCLVPADGFYEWQRVAKRKQPHFINQVDRSPFAFAGLWDRWRGPDGVWMVSFAIVTCPPNRVVEPLHDRMPVVVAPGDWDRWLAREPLPPEALDDILVPADAASWRADPVGDFVNRADHEGPECIESRPVQGSLF